MQACSKTLFYTQTCIAVVAEEDLSVVDLVLVQDALAEPLVHPRQLARGVVGHAPSLLFLCRKKTHEDDSCGSRSSGHLEVDVWGLAVEANPARVQLLRQQLAVWGACQMSCKMDWYDQVLVVPLPFAFGGVEHHEDAVCSPRDGNDLHACMHEMERGYMCNRE